ncbi:MAG TPA: Imm72 family immunity protein [Polyangiaceae bacterium]|nr:Imm72 family immunity protein [Polyangiaceae bacterium]
MKNWIFGNPVFSTTQSLEGNELPVTDAERARAFWRLRRYTSFAYIERQAEHLNQLIEGFKSEARRAADPYAMRDFTQMLAVLYRHDSHYQKGLALLRPGDVGGFDFILEGAKVASYFESRMFYEHEDLRWFAFGSEEARPLVGLLAWGRRTYTLARNTLRTLRAEWTFELLRDPRPSRDPCRLPERCAALPAPQPGAARCSPGQPVPTTGVWLPTDRRSGCPNYLVSRWIAPEAMATVASSENAAIESGYPEYTYERRASRWELCWEDVRLSEPETRGGSEFLGDDVAFPDEPLEIMPHS